MKNEESKLFYEPVIFVPVMLVILFVIWSIHSTISHNIKEQTRNDVNEKIIMLLEECRNVKTEPAPIVSAPVLPPEEEKKLEKLEQEILTPTEKEAEKINDIVKELTK